MLKEPSVLDFQFDDVDIKLMFPEKEFIVEVNPSDSKVNIQTWCSENRDFIDSALTQFGGIAFRGFNLTPVEFPRVADTICPDPALSYTGGIAPRENFGNGVYLSTTIDKRCEIPQHHEMSYFRQWPSKVFFYCETPATTGGETTIASTRSFMKRLDPAIIDKFEEREVMYIRNYVEGINSNWQDSFETSDRSTVERNCRALGLDAEWLENDRLRTRNVSQGVAAHPVTGEKLWHNHAHVYNLCNSRKDGLTPTLRMTKDAYSPEMLDTILSSPHDELPTNTYYGDGELIETDVIEEISSLLNQEKVSFTWNAGDFMLLDNMLAFHGRNPYEGDQRKVLTMLK